MSGAFLLRPYLNLAGSLRLHSEKCNRVSTMGSREDNQNSIINLQNITDENLNYEGSNRDREEESDSDKFRIIWGMKSRGFCCFGSEGQIYIRCIMIRRHYFQDCSYD